MNHMEPDISISIHKDICNYGKWFVEVKKKQKLGRFQENLQVKDKADWIL